MDYPEHVELKNIETIKKICSFIVGYDGVGIGDTDYGVIDLRPGLYDAYRIDDNLMIINNDLNIDPKPEDVKKWQWTYTYEGVGVDSGTFGFYDVCTLIKLNKLLNNDDDEQLPSFEFTKKDYESDYIIIDGSYVENLSNNEKKKIGNFGVIADTITGDGGFECYAINNDRAILFGGLTAEKLF